MVKKVEKISEETTSTSPKAGEPNDGALLTRVLDQPNTETARSAPATAMRGNGVDNHCSGGGSQAMGGDEKPDRGRNWWANDPTTGSTKGAQTPATTAVESPEATPWAPQMYGRMIRRLRSRTNFNIKGSTEDNPRTHINQ